jgi:hypothetical protein
LCAIIAQVPPKALVSEASPSYRCALRRIGPRQRESNPIPDAHHPPAPLLRAGRARAVAEDPSELRRTIEAA